MEGRVDKVASSWNQVYELREKELRVMEEIESNRGLSFPEKKRKKRKLRNLREEISRQVSLIREVL